MDISLIIVNYNSKKYLSNCLESIYQNTKDFAFEVIVVDNASSDDSIKLIKKEFSQVKVIANKTNKGFAAANNQGIKICSGEYVMLLNHDTEVRHNALEVLYNFMKENPQAGACGAKLLNSDGTIQHQCKRGFPTPLSILFYMTGLHKVFPKNKLFGHYLMTHLDPQKVGEVDALSGACMLIRRSVIEKVGMLAEVFFLYGEDIDLCYRIKQAGSKVYYVPQAEIIHYGGVGSRVMSYKNIIEFHRSMYIFYNKYYKGKYPLFVTWLVYLGVALKCGLNLFFNFIRKEKFVGTKKP